ncbi:MAG: DUF1109 family protein [Bauldia sp.]|nr:DUF1109 family protein [Bauldia sp.]MCW5718696.1 DUF1109 family protein [Bauldia sp.]
MAETRLDDLIDGLAGRLVPVRRLRPPLLRAVFWLAGLVALASAFYVGLGGNAGLMGTRAYVLPAFLAALATAVLAAIAAFQLSVPDRSDRWVLLPLPTAALWLAFSGLGCLADLGVAGTWGESFVEMRQCLLVILGSAIPLSLLMVLMLRRARPERFGRVALVAGIASAAAAGAVLMLVHPHTSTVLDLLVHGLCVAAVIGLNVVFGGRLLGRTQEREPA